MARNGHPFSDDTAYGCLTHSRFRHPDTGEWVQATSLQLAQVAQAFRYCGMEWRVQCISCDQCEETTDAIRHAPPHVTNRACYHPASRVGRDQWLKQ
jgi:hypothetical protein